MNDYVGDNIRDGNLTHNKITYFYESKLISLIISFRTLNMNHINLQQLMKRE
jgi:hypothetical protein